MKIVSHVAMIFLLLPTLVYSSDWKCISYAPPAIQITDPKTGEEKTVYPKNAGECQGKIDAANLKYMRKGHVRVWVSTKLSHGDKGFTWRKDLYEIDCADHRWRFLQIGFDVLAETVPPEGPSPWYWTEPDSTEDALSKTVCKH